MQKRGHRSPSLCVSPHLRVFHQDVQKIGNESFHATASQTNCMLHATQSPLYNFFLCGVAIQHLSEQRPQRCLRQSQHRSQRVFSRPYCSRRVSEKTRFFLLDETWIFRPPCRSTKNKLYDLTRLKRIARLSVASQSPPTMLSSAGPFSEN